MIKSSHFKFKLFLSILLLLGIFVIPVLAIDSPNYGEITDVLSTTKTITHAISGDTISRSLTTLGFKNPKYFGLNGLKEIDFNGNVCSGGGPCNVGLPPVNASQWNMQFTNSSGVVVGTGIESYSIGMQNNIQLKIIVNSWDTTKMLGNGITAENFNLVYTSGGYVALSTPGNYYIYMGGLVSDWDWQFNNYQWPTVNEQVKYVKYLDIFYDRQPGYDLLSGLDLITMFPSDFNYQNIATIQAINTIDGVDQDVFNATINLDPYSIIGTVGSLKIFLQNESTQKLIITCPFNGNIHGFNWDGGILYNQATLDADKGVTSTDYLTALEFTRAYFNYNGDVSRIKYVHWVWSEGDSTGIYSKWADYKYNSTLGGWDYDGLPPSVSPLDFATKVQQHNVKFMYDDFDNNWSVGSTPHNWVTVTIFDSNHQQIGITATLPLWVGNSNLNPQTRISIEDVYYHILNNGQLYVYDNTSSAYIVNGEIITTGQKLVSSTIGHTYTIWGNVVDMRFLNGVYDYYNPYPSQQTWSYSGAAGLTYTVTGSGIKDAILFFQSTGLNETYYPKVTFHVTTADYNYPTNANAQVCSSDGSLNALGNLCENVIILNGYGNTVLTEVGKNYTYVVSPTSGTYIPVSGSFVATSGLVIEVKFYLPGQTTIPTTTIPTTTLPGGFSPGVDLFSFFAQYGITVNMVKLLFAGLIMLTCAGALVYYGGSTMGAMVGAGIGFVLDIGLGLVELWIAILLIVVFGLIFAGRLVLASGD